MDTQTLQDIAVYQALTDELPCGVFFLDAQMRITYWNRGAELLSGYSPDEMVGVRCADCGLAHVDERGNALCTTVCPVEGALQDALVHVAHMYMHHRDGHRVSVEQRVLPVQDEHRNLIGVVVVFTDEPFMTEAARKVRSMERTALEDPETGLGNREFLQRVIRARAAEMQHLDAPFGVILARIDGLDRIRERQGDEVAAGVLNMVGRTLSRNCRHYDVVGRWGDEEMMLVVRARGVEDIRRAGDRLRVLVATSYRTVDDTPIAATVSMGGAIGTEGLEVDALVEQASSMMAQSVNEGGNRISV